MHSDHRTARPGDLRGVATKHDLHLQAMILRRARRLGGRILSNAADFFSKQTVVSLLLLLLLGIAVAGASMVNLSSKLINSQALQNSVLYANALQQARTYYSENVVKKLGNQESIKADYDHIHKPDAVPIPATFLIELGQRISSDTSGVSVSLFSDHPFSFRTRQKPLDKFDRDALAFLINNPDKNFTRITNMDGEQTFRYAQADIMKASCVACHNSHPQSTKRDWKVGDVRGVLEVSTSIDSLLQENRQRLASTLVMLGGLLGIAATGIWIVFSRLKSVSVELEQKVQIRTKELSTANQSLSTEQEKSKNLLLNILPEAIVTRLQGGEKDISDAFGSVSILFADIVNFTPLSQEIPPAELVEILNRIFSEFDDLSEKYGLEKIKTIGDAYMVACGLPQYREDHADQMAKMALSMQDVIHNIALEIQRPIDIRIGINSGPVVAGVIGKKKFIYDLWGDTVNIASRMESHAINGSIQISESTYKLLKGKYSFEDRGIINIKGKGAMQAYLLKSRISNPDEDRNQPLAVT